MRSGDARQSCRDSTPKRRPPPPHRTQALPESQSRSRASIPVRPLLISFLRLGILECSVGGKREFALERWRPQGEGRKRVRGEESRRGGGAGKFHAPSR